MEVRVVVADDDARVRAAVADLLGDDDRVLVVAQTTDGASTAQAVVEHDAHLVLLDVRMPGGGAQAARQVRELGRWTAVLALSAHADRSTVVQVLETGAVGYLVKGEVGADLPDFVVRAARGERVLSPSAARAVDERV